MPNPQLSIVITAYNPGSLSVIDGNELIMTVDAIKKTTSDYEIILVDDGSDDGSCDEVQVDRVIKHKKRIGIAYSRCAGAEAARGDVVCFLDSHHTMDEGCLNRCAQAAIDYNAIIWPDVRGLKDGEPRPWTGHGGRMSQKIEGKRGLFNGDWKRRRTKYKLSRSETLLVPGYCIPKTVWPQVKPADGLRGWGATEPAITVKAFFACVDIFHLCGTMCRHGFRAGKRIPYTTRWDAVVRNHAITAYVCFDDQTWEKYWRRQIFRKWLKGNEWDEFYEPPLKTQHEDFMSIKKRPDKHFWTHLIKTDAPRGVA